MEWQERSHPTPPVFCKKRLQVDENKGMERGKERQENSGGGKLLRRRSLRWRHRDLAADPDSAAKAHLQEADRREGAGTLSAEPWIREYRIGYYLSSEKLKTVD
jgi:hypothetical protein